MSQMIIFACCCQGHAVRDTGYQFVCHIVSLRVHSVSAEMFYQMGIALYVPHVVETVKLMVRLSRFVCFSETLKQAI